MHGIAQNTHRMAEEGNTWYEHGVFYGLSEVYSEVRSSIYAKYFIKGDTLIGSAIFKKMYLEGIDSSYTYRIINNIYYPLIPVATSDNYDTIDTTTAYYSPQYVGAFLQDSLKVFFILKDSTDSQMHLYCDFNLQVNDTVNYYYHRYSPITVSSISSVPFGNKIRKCYTLSNSSKFYDGIGSDFGLLSDYVFNIGGSMRPICFKQNNIIQHIANWDSIPSHCDFTLPFSSPPKKEVLQKQEILIYPNPAYNYIILELTQLNSSYIVMTNNLGQVIYKVNRKNTKTQIDVSSFAKGIYYLKVVDSITNETIATKKIIIE